MSSTVDIGNSVISAHRDRHFHSLGRVVVGDTIVTESDAGRVAWMVRDIRVVGADAPALRAATAFALRYFEGYDNARIAEILGTSQMVVAVTLHRARTRLRKEIGLREVKLLTGSKRLWRRVLRPKPSRREG